MKIPDGDYWTSGTDFECPNTFFWCSKEAEFVPSEIAWKPGHPDAAAGDCVHVQVRNLTKNMSLLATSSCSELKNYICEVRQKGTKGKAMSAECMALWDVTEGEVTFCICDTVLFLILNS